MSGEIEVDSAYRGVAASWLGIDTNIYAKRKANKSQVKTNYGESESSPQEREKNKKKVTTNYLIKNKIEKKISSVNYWKSQNRFENKRKRPHEEDEEESKSSLVKAKKDRTINRPSSTSLNPSVHELNTKLLDPTLSKKARKRIRKKIAMLTQGNT
ncbi:hypothetical protein SNE40_015516 [Patella caerulea]|uniref:Uncharacterized protein n=1 Tax=Patella caerulea TaxID=87958 RepID=A0AAN8JK51_PATCE